MKIATLKYVILCLLGLMLCSFSCSESEDFVIRDFSPIEMKMYVMNEEGYNLLDENTENNLLGNAIKAINNGAAYYLDTSTVEEEKEPVSRALHATFYGLKLMKDRDGQPYVCFGEFDGARNFDNEIITLDWGDGTYNTVTFDSRVSWQKSEPIIHRYFYLDKELVNNTMTLYKRK